MDQSIVTDPSNTTTRDHHLSVATDTKKSWDIIVIGGGATGAGIALDAASRGYSVLLLESKDFGKGTSSRSTKLIHGGVRYLGQMQFGMVRESLRERGVLRINAPHLVHELEFIIPCKSRLDRLFYGAGLKLYDLLASGSKMPRSHQVTTSQLVYRMPGLAQGKFVGGVAYSDAQFDDTRLLIEIVRAAVDYCATILNYAPVEDLIKNERGKVLGVLFRDGEGGQSHQVHAQCIINATGPFCDAIRRLDQQDVAPLVSASQGIHLVLPKSYFESASALIVPKTSDGRVLFVIPWKDHVLVGTTDTPIDRISEEPKPFPQEIEFLLQTLEEYCGRRPSPSECLSVFAGIRPLAKGNKQQATKKLSRDHTIEVSGSGLVTITGGKWTTYRHMAEDCVDQVSKLAGLEFAPTRTQNIRLDRTQADRERLTINDSTGNQNDVPILKSLKISKNDLICGVRFEFARTVEDLLSRRTRALFLNVEAAKTLAPMAAGILADELGRDETWKRAQIDAFHELAKTYSPELT